MNPAILLATLAFLIFLAPGISAADQAYVKAKP